MSKFAIITIAVCIMGGVLFGAYQSSRQKQADLTDVPPVVNATSFQDERSFEVMSTPTGLQYADLVVGTGQQPQKGDSMTVDYTGWLANGKNLDSSFDGGRGPFQFTLGEGQVIEGWDEGIATMKAGGMRKLIIPPQLAYGEHGIPGIIPKNSTLIFKVHLVGVGRGMSKTNLMAK